MVLPSRLGPIWNVLSLALFGPRPEVVVPGVGRLRGTTLPSTERRRPVDAYWGVPYAAPPTGRLRLVGGVG